MAAPQPDFKTLCEELEQRHKGLVDERAHLLRKSAKADKIVRSLRGQIQTILDRALLASRELGEYVSSDEELNNTDQRPKHKLKSSDENEPKKTRRRQPS